MTKCSARAAAAEQEGRKFLSSWSKIDPNIYPMPKTGFFDLKNGKQNNAAENEMRVLLKFSLSKSKGRELKKNIWLFFWHDVVWCSLANFDYWSNAMLMDHSF